MKKSFPLYKTYRHRLSQADLFHGLPTELLDDMLIHFRFETWNKGTHQSSKITTERFFIVIEGRLEVIKINPVSGKQLTLAILSQGDVYNILSLMDGQEHEATPVALTDLKLMSAPVDTVRTWIEQHPEFNKNFMPYLSKRIRDIEALTTDLGLYDTPTRLARLVMRYAAKEKEGGAIHPSAIDVKLLHDFSNEAIANMISAARQVVNRHLQKMKKEGILHFQDHHLLVDDLEKLKKHADGLL